MKTLRLQFKALLGDIVLSRLHLKSIWFMSQISNVWFLLELNEIHIYIFTVFRVLNVFG
jgi:hypothetical protein